MATNFNVSPYYDDFSESSNFHKVLFRPAYSIQARKLTQLQSILQNQVQRFGQHMFKDGSQVIPGEVTVWTIFEYVKLASFSTSAVSGLEDVLMTGGTSGVVGQVSLSQAATTTTAATLFVVYTKTGTDNTTLRFSDGETLTGTNSAGTTVTAVVGTSGTALPIASNATGIGSAVKVEEGVYFVNGYFVKNAEQTLILEAYSNTPSYRVGFTITETFVTPESDTALKDNATGSSNINAPGAHRYKIALTLAKLSLTTTEDSDFVDLIRLNNGLGESKVVKTQYNILEHELARRTHDESGNYVTKPFDIDVREHYKLDGDTTYTRGIYATDTDSKYENGLYTLAESQARLAMGMGPGKAYVQGYEQETTGTKYLTIKKAQDFDEVNNSSTSLLLGNSLEVTSVYGSVDLGTVSGETEAYKELALHKEQTVSRGVARGTSNNDIQQIGRAKPRYFEYKSGTAGSLSTNTTSIYKLGLFDVQMFTHITVTTAQGFDTGEILTGGTSGATGIIESISTSSSELDAIASEEGTFDQIVLNSTSGASTNAGSNIGLESAA